MPFTTLDIVALAWFAAAWASYALMLEYAPLQRKGLNARMNQYREVWNAGLTGACNLYRVTPMKPAMPGQPAPQIPTLPRERLTIAAPTFVLWALDDSALLPGLLEGLEDYVPKLDLKKVPGATHWLVHEQPEFVAREIEAFVRRTQ